MRKKPADLQSSPPRQRSQPADLVIEVRGGVVEAVFLGRWMLANFNHPVVVRDWDNIKSGEPDPMCGLSMSRQRNWKQVL